MKRRIKIKQTCLEEEVDPITPGSNYKTHYAKKTWLPSLTGKKCLILFCYDFVVHLLNMARFMVLFTIEFVKNWLKVDVVSSRKFRRDLKHPWHDLVILGACFVTSKVVAWLVRSWSDLTDDNFVCIVYETMNHGAINTNFGMIFSRCEHCINIVWPIWWVISCNQRREHLRKNCKHLG